MLFLHLALDYFGVATNLVLAAALVIGGGYLAFYVAPLRLAGVCVLAFGIALGAYTLGRGSGIAEGSATVMAEWKAKNYEAKIASLEQEASAKKEAAEISAAQTADLASKNEQAQQQVNDYASTVSKLSESLQACRIASDADVRQLCGIAGDAAAGCKNSR